MAAKTAPAPWRSRIVGTGTEAPDQLVANPRNWRTHPGPQRDALRGSLDSVGWVQQVMVNRVTGHVVDGHARVEEALSRGEPTVPVLYVELSEEEEALVLATLDPIGAMAATDADRLTALLAEVGDHDAGLDALLASLAPEVPVVGLTDPDAVPEVADDGGVRRGDIYALGDHRLMCGDSTDGGDVALLMDGECASLLATDPPYGVAYADKNEWLNVTDRGNRVQSPIVGDHLDLDAAAELWEAAFALACDHSRPGAAYYSFSAPGVFQTRLAGALAAAGWLVKHQLVWVKNNHVLGRLDYHYRHEPIWYGWKDGGHAFYGGHSETSVLAFDRPMVNDLHPTMKPVELLAHLLTNSAIVGEIVLDPFVGSGSTIIAAEKTGRLCYAMEIEPRYVAVSIRRWEDFTGRKAVKVA